MIWWILATVTAFFVKGLCGFGDGLLFGTMMSFASNNVIITPVQTLMSLPSNAMLVWQNRKRIQLSVCLPVMVMMIVGDTMGAFLLKNMDAHLLKVLLGVIVTALGVEMLLRGRGGKKKKPPKWVLGVIGVVSGIVCGMFSVGTMLTAYFSRVTDDMEAFKGNLCLVFTTEVLYRVIIYSCTGVITLQILQRALLLMPFMIAAMFGGMYSGSVLSEKAVRKVVVWVLIFSGIALALTNL